MNPLTDPHELAADLSRQAVTVIDVQYNLRGTPGPELYAVAHLPGAPHLDLDAALAGPPGVRGRHPLPDPHVLEAALRACGIDDDDEVVTERQVGPITVTGDGPLVVREKSHGATPMTLDTALYEMELVGHDFYLFVDKESERPSVVYRRRGYDYGVISLDLAG